MVREACDAAHRSASSRRDIHQIVSCSGCGALGEIKAEPQFIERAQFEADEQFGCLGGRFQSIQYRRENIVQFRMRIAFGQKPQERRECLEAIYPG